MPATEEKMGAGDFRLEFVPTIPTAVLDRIDPRVEVGLGGAGFAQLYVIAQPMKVGRITQAALLAKAAYCGIIKGMGDDRMSIEGEGQLCLLGDDQEGGTFRLPPATTTGARTLTQHLTTTILLGTSDANGLTVGTVDDPGAGVTINASLQPGSTKRALLDTIPGLFAAPHREYYVRPSGAVDVRLPANLWSSGKVLLSPDGGAASGPVRSVQADLTLGGVGVDGYANRAVVNWDGTANFGDATQAAPTTWRDLGGNLISWWTYLDWSPRGRIRGRETLAKIAAWLANGQTQANNLAVNELNRRASYRIEVQAEIDEFNPWDLGKPGDKFYVYSLRQRIYDKTTVNKVPHRGRQILPKLLELLSWTIPFRGGYTYVVRAWSTTLGAYELIDVTRWAVPEDDYATLTLGPKMRHHRRRVRPRRGGYRWPRGVPWNRRLYGRRITPVGR